MPTPIIPSADYYADEDLHGNYQYVTLEDLVNNFVMSGDEDDYTSNVDRYKVLFQTRRAFKELYFDVMREIKAIELELSPTLNVVLPPDFVNYVRISWVDDKGKLHPMAVDDKMSIAKKYLQDHEYEILFDSNGCVLEGFDEGLDLNPETGEPIIPETDVITEACHFKFNGNFEPNKNFSEVFQNGRYQIDKNNGLIHFGSEIFGTHVVLEYISDGLYTGCEGRAEAELRIHKFAEQAVYDWVYWKLIERRRNVPANEKKRARDEWFNSRRLTKRRINTIRANELRQTFMGSNKWIKGV